MSPTTLSRGGSTLLMSWTEPRTASRWSPYKRGARKALRLRLCGILAGVSLVLFSVPAGALAQQQTAARESRSESAPDAIHSEVFPRDSATKAPDVEPSANVVGTVRDVSGASVSGADVSLIPEGGAQSQTTVSAADGEFSFTKILPGSYSLVVNAENFATFTSAEFVVAVQQSYEVPNVSLTLATKNTEVTVHPAEFVAAEQIRAAEKQRLLGVIPNFYTSYTLDAAPMTAKQKFQFAARGTFDPVSMLGVGFGAGIEQATNAFSGYGQGAAGYGKRFGAKFADGRDSDFLTHAVFPSLFHQDPRYFYLGPGSPFKTRLAHAVGSAFFTRNDNGLTAPNYSYLLGDVSAAALSNLYYPRANRGVSLVFTNAAVGLAGRIGGNILREFSKRVTTNVPEDRAQ